MSAQSEYETRWFDAACAGNIQLVKWLLIASPALIDAVTTKQFTALHCAALYGHSKLVATLLAIKPSLSDAVDQEGNTALHHAAEAGFDGMCGHLLTASPSLAARVTRNGFSPLHFAANKGHENVATRLLATANPETIVAIVGFNGFTAFHFAARRGHCSIIAQLLAVSTRMVGSPDSVGYTPLHHAAMFGRHQIVRQLLAAKPDLIHVVGSKRTALHFAVEAAQEVAAEVLLAAIPFGCPESHLHFEDLDNDGNNVLNLAIRSRSVGFIERLWKRNLNALHVKNLYQDTPLHHAAKSGNEAVISLFEGSAEVDELSSALGVVEFTTRYRSIIEEQCELLRTQLNQDVITHVFGYLGFEPIKRQPPPQKN